MSGKPKTAAFNLKPQGILGDSAIPLLAFPQNNMAEVPLNAISLPPFATLVAAIR